MTDHLYFITSVEEIEKDEMKKMTSGKYHSHGWKYIMTEKSASDKSVIHLLILIKVEAEILETIIWIENPLSPTQKKDLEIWMGILIEKLKRVTASAGSRLSQERRNTPLVIQEVQFTVNNNHSDWDDYHPTPPMTQLFVIEKRTANQIVFRWREMYQHRPVIFMFNPLNKHIKSTEKNNNNKVTEVTRITEKKGQYIYYIHTHQDPEFPINDPFKLYQNLRESVDINTIGASVFHWWIDDKIEELSGGGGASGDGGDDKDEEKKKNAVNSTPPIITPPKYLIYTYPMKLNLMLSGPQSKKYTIFLVIRSSPSDLMEYKFAFPVLFIDLPESQSHYLPLQNFSFINQSKKPIITPLEIFNLIHGIRVNPSNILTSSSSSSKRKSVMNHQHPDHWSFTRKINLFDDVSGREWYLDLPTLLKTHNTDITGKGTEAETFIAQICLQFLFTYYFSPFDPPNKLSSNESIFTFLCDPAERISIQTTTTTKHIDDVQFMCFNLGENPVKLNPARSRLIKLMDTDHPKMRWMTMLNSNPRVISPRKKKSSSIEEKNTTPLLYRHQALIQSNQSLSDSKPSSTSNPYFALVDYQSQFELTPTCTLDSSSSLPLPADSSSHSILTPENFSLLDEHKFSRSQPHTHHSSTFPNDEDVGMNFMWQLEIDLDCRLIMEVSNLIELEKSTQSLIINFKKLFMEEIQSEVYSFLDDAIEIFNTTSNTSELFRFSSSSQTTFQEIIKKLALSYELLKLMLDKIITEQLEITDLQLSIIINSLIKNVILPLKKAVVSIQTLIQLIEKHQEKEEESMVENQLFTVVINEKYLSIANAMEYLHRQTNNHLIKLNNHEQIKNLPRSSSSDNFSSCSSTTTTTTTVQVILEEISWTKLMEDVIFGLEFSWITHKFSIPLAQISNTFSFWYGQSHQQQQQHQQQRDESPRVSSSYCHWWMKMIRLWYLIKRLAEQAPLSVPSNEKSMHNLINPLNNHPHFKITALIPWSLHHFREGVVIHDFIHQTVIPSHHITQDFCRHLHLVCPWTHVVVKCDQMISDLGQEHKPHTTLDGPHTLSVTPWFHQKFIHSRVHQKIIQSLIVHQIKNLPLSAFQRIDNMELSLADIFLWPSNLHQQELPVQDNSLLNRFNHLKESILLYQQQLSPRSKLSDDIIIIKRLTTTALLTEMICHLSGHFAPHHPRHHLLYAYLILSSLDSIIRYPSSFSSIHQLLPSSCLDHSSSSSSSSLLPDGAFPPHFHPFFYPDETISPLRVMLNFKQAFPFSIPNTPVLSHFHQHLSPLFEPRFVTFLYHVFSHDFWTFIGSPSSRHPPFISQLCSKLFLNFSLLSLRDIFALFHSIRHLISSSPSSSQSSIPIKIGHAFDQLTVKSTPSFLNSLILQFLQAPIYQLSDFCHIEKCFI